MTDLKDIIAAIPKLSPIEHAQIIAAIKASASIGGTPAKMGKAMRADADPSVLFVLDAIVKDMKDQGRDNTTVAMAMALGTFHAFAVKCPPVHEFVTASMPTLNKRRALMQVMVRLLREDLQKMDLAITTRMMMAHAHRLQAVLHRSLPGYAENNLLHLLIRTHEEKYQDGE